MCDHKMTEIQNAKKTLAKMKISKFEIIVMVFWFVLMAVACYIVYLAEMMLSLWVLGVLLGYVLKGMVMFFTKKRRLRRKIKDA